MPTEMINGYHMYYEVHGAGDPFVWIHGSLGGGEGSAGFSAQHAAAMADHFRFIIFDRRTAGRSESPPDGYSMKVFAEDVVSLLRHLSIDRAHVMGSSAGGPIALTLALDHPELVKTLHLVNTMTYGSAPERQARQEELDAAIEVERLHGREAAAEQALLFRQPYLKVERPEQFQTLYNIRLERFDGINRTIQAYLDIGDSIDKRLGEIRVPTLIDHGSADTTIPVRCANDLHRGIAGSEIHIIPGAVHGLTQNEPELTRKFILDFLDRVPQPAR
ncbi:MAG: alpha/beta hydrolase [Chloroflexi bacterium]|nr:alpha/beta hydrolase [Chloroflexota bacterium]